MPMSKFRRERSSSALAVGIAWFDREQWHELCEVAADRSKLDDTYEEWEANARQALANLKSGGVNAEPLEVRVAELLQWCTERNLTVDSASRAEYVSFMLKRKRSGA
jgi:hypothetical protein